MRNSANYDIQTADAQVYTVSALNRETKALLAEHFMSVWVEGEISNLANPSSGHIYFTLKDANAQVRCAMFRMHRRKLTFKPTAGTQVLVKAQVSLYETRGDYQLIVEHMEESGDGALRRAFDALKARLADEGLFDPEVKKPLPKVPKQLGIITSATGAAVRDILTVLKRRFPTIPVLIYPVSVQGSEAKFEIVDAIEIAEQSHECDVLIIARGGGSLEDLWAFNEEIVARAIAECTIPVVTGIGHEIDFTIADFVADHRAPTPSAAAELVSPNQSDWLNQFAQLQAQLSQCLKTQLLNHAKLIEWLEKRLQQVHPGRRLQDRTQRLDELELRICRSVQNRLTESTSRLAALSAKLKDPSHKLKALDTQQQHLAQRLLTAINREIEQPSNKLSELSRALDSVSPLATLSRGYAIVSKSDDGEILRSSNEASTGDILETRLCHGSLICKVTEIQ